MTDDRTPNLNLALPHQDNLLLQDVVRLRSALTTIDSELHGILSKFGAANGLAQLDSSGKVPASQLPSYVDDVLEFASLAAFPGAGEQGKIYVALDTGEQYRWSGSAYIVISPSPGSTDDVPEGSVNRYFTDARARAAQLPATGSTLGVVKVGANLSVAPDGTLSALGGGTGGPGVPAFNELVLTPSSNGQTVFTPAGGYDAGQIELYLNGVMLYGNGDDYTASDGVQIILAAGVTTADSLLLRRWTTADSLPFSAITDKPTTLAGYGITDAAPASEVVPKSGGAYTGPVEVPAGASGAQVPQAQETAMLATTQFGLRNRFVNPDFSIWQNGLSFTSNAGISYCAAQWIVADAGAGLNVARSFADSDACVIKNGASGHTTGWLAQPIESYGIRDLTGANAVGQITVAIDIICTAAQTGSIAVWRAGAEDNFTSPVFISSSAWTHPGGGVRQRKTATFTLPADAKNGIVIYFNHNAIAAGQHIRFARAQCEAGPLATSFAARPPAFEMALCQRYYEVGTAVIWQGQQASYRANAYVTFNTWKRVTPLMTYQAVEQNGYGSYDVNYVNPQGFNYHVIATATTSDGRAAINWQANARLM